MAITAEGLDIVGVGQFLFAHFLAVPTNQRAYTWQSDHVEDFWNDILHAMENTDEDYFIGSIVLTRSEGSALEVVDGQQRLATATIIYGAVRDYLQKHDQKAHAEPIKRYLCDQDEDTLEWLPKLTLNIDDDSFFRKHVISEAANGKRENPIEQAKKKKSRIKDSNRNIWTAAETIRNRVYEFVGSAPPASAAAKLKKLTKYIKERVKVISVIVPNHESAYTIFETLNDRGLELSKADLLKNHLHRTVGANKLKTVQNHWSAMVGAIEAVSKEDETVNYIRYLWISEHGHVREKNLYAQLKHAITHQAEALDFSETLAENAVLFASLLNSDHPRWSEYGEVTQANLSNLIHIGIDRLHPITLAVMRHFTKNEFQKAIAYLVCAAVRITLAGPPAGTLEQAIAAKAPSINANGIKTAKALSESLLAGNVVPGDAAFRSAFASASGSKATLIRYYLRALENANSRDEQPWVVTREQIKGTVEHILPERPSPHWKNFTEDEAKAYRRRLGNLVLLTAKQNVAVANGPFEKEKAPVYAESRVPLTKEVGKNKFAPRGKVRWGKEEIEKRQLRLADLAVKAWPATM